MKGQGHAATLGARTVNLDEIIHIDLPSLQQAVFHLQRVNAHLKGGKGGGVQTNVALMRLKDHGRAHRASAKHGYKLQLHS